MINREMILRMSIMSALLGMIAILEVLIQAKWGML